MPHECKKKALDQLKNSHCKIVDAPLSGNRLAALEGKLSAYLSGDEPDKIIAKKILVFFVKR